MRVQLKKEAFEMADEQARQWIEIGLLEVAPEVVEEAAEVVEAPKPEPKAEVKPEPKAPKSKKSKRADVY